MDKISYALGLSMGQQLLSSGVEKLNYADLAKGIEHVLEKQQPEIAYTEAQTILNQFFTELEQKIAGQAKEAGEKFLAENAKRPEVKTTRLAIRNHRGYYRAKTKSHRQSEGAL